MKDNLAYIDHIQQCICKIKEYTKNFNQSDFSKAELIQDAVIRNIEIIGEATKKISPDFKARYNEVPWKEMAGMRDKLIHDYFGADVEVVWKTIQEDIPMLDLLIRKITEL